MQAAIEIPVAFELQSSNQVRYGIGSTLHCNGFTRAWRPRSLETSFPECRLGWADARCQMVYPQTPLLRGGYRGYLVFLLAVSQNAKSDASATIWPLASTGTTIDTLYTIQKICFADMWMTMGSPGSGTLSTILQVTS